MQHEARRALEAVIMVSDQPADPALLAQLVELSPEAVEEILAELSRQLRGAGTRVPAREGSGRLAFPEPRGLRSLR
ncbi:MAG: hypothetical protein V9E94_04310 [Microthrixaceae bacterium]